MTSNTRLDPQTVLKIYKKAALIKQNDERVIKEMTAGRLVMPYYSARGQEIIPSVLSLHLRDDDYVSTIYRGTHDMLAKGYPLDAMWAELAGRVTGSCKGKGGPMHLTYPEKGIMVTTGIVGSSMPIAVGLGWAAQLDGKGQVSVANFGDGAANIGAFHESLNLAALWDLPVIFVCQNNRYAEHTSMARSTKAKNLSDRAIGYGMAGVTVDGNNPDEFYAVAGEAVNRARAGKGPTLIEAMTFRFNGHLIGDAGGYIDKGEYESAVENDPFPKLRQRVLDEGAVSEEELVAIEADLNEQIDAAARAALNADFPDAAELKRDVFAQEIA